jgi:hypothetical protein
MGNSMGHVGRHRVFRLAALLLVLNALPAQAQNQSQTNPALERARVTSNLVPSANLSQPVASGATDGTYSPGTTGQGGSGGPNQAASTAGAAQKIIHLPPGFVLSGSSSGAPNSVNPAPQAGSAEVVPALIGMTRTAVRQLFAQRTAAAYNRVSYPLALNETANQQCDAQRDVVLNQNPPAGTPLAQAGGRVEAIFAFAEERIQVPDLSAMNRQQALDTLAARRLCPGAIQSQAAEGAAGVVLHSAPAAGQMVLQGTVIDLVLSAASPPNPPPKPPRRVPPALPPSSVVPPPPVLTPPPPRPPLLRELGWMAAVVIAALLLWRLLRPRPAASASALGYAVQKSAGHVAARTRSSGIAGQDLQLRSVRAAPTVRIEYRRNPDV